MIVDVVDEPGMTPLFTFVPAFTFGKLVPPLVIVVVPDVGVTVVVPPGVPTLTTFEPVVVDYGC